MELSSFRSGDNSKISEVRHNNNNSNKKDVVDTEKIDTIFTTKQIETKRGEFSESFKENDIDSKNSKEGKKFLDGLNNNKASLSKDLGLSDDEYDSFACVAMALASQETGMGLEDGIGKDKDGNWIIGYKSHGNPLYEVAKKAIGDSSASSGLTQIKIYEYLQNGSSEMKGLLEKYGITAESETKNNLNEPDKAVIATMIYLADLAKNSYSEYEDLIRTEHQNVRSELDPSLTDEECLEKGEDIINSIKNVYEEIDDNKKEDVRTTLKQWLLGLPGYNDDRYNEEKQLVKLNEQLKDYGVNIKQSDLDYIRYYLTDEKQDASPIEYLAYAWNKGTGETGMKLDRILADKIGVIFSNPERFDYDQFTVNIEELTDLYGQQAGSDIDEINDLIDNYMNNN